MTLFGDDMPLDKLFDIVDQKLDTKRLNKVFFVMVAIVLILIPIAGYVGAKTRSGLAYTQVCDGKRVEITADDALTLTESEKSHVYVDPGEHIVIESDLTISGIRVYAVSGFHEAFDDTVKGQSSVTLDVEPGDWTIGTFPEDGATGTVTVVVE